MDAKRFVLGTVVGGLVLFGLGYLIWEVLFGGFFAANAGPATGVAREPWVLWAVIAGNLSMGALITVVLGWARASSVGAAVRVAATAGFLIWLGVDLTLYGVWNVSNLTATIVDPFLELVHFGITGGVIAAVTGKGQAGTAA